MKVKNILKKNTKKRLFIDHILYKIRLESKFYYNLYLTSIFFLYITILVFSWYFIFFSKSINQDVYNNIGNIGSENNYVVYSPLKIIFILSTLLNIYFYILNEIRFKLLIDFKKIRKWNSKIGNILTILSSLIIFISTLIFLKMCYATV